jgi:hypothetical protein
MLKPCQQHCDNLNPQKNCLLFNPLNAELNPNCHFLALLGAHHILHVSWIRVKQSESLVPCLQEPDTNPIN